MKVGDKVKYANSHEATIVNENNLKQEFLVEFDDKTLIPPQMWVPEYGLTLVAISLPIGSQNNTATTEYSWLEKLSIESNCPACMVPWSETTGFTKSYYDCRRCGAKKEQYDH